MKIWLVNPSYRSVYGNFTAPEHPPLGLASIAAILIREHHDVRIIDFDAERLDNEQFALVLKTEKPDVVGITATTPVISNAFSIAQVVKDHTAAFTVIGGVHATLLPMDCAKCPAVDFVVIGEGDLTFLELVNGIENHDDLSSIKGLVYKDKDKIHQNMPRELIQDLDALPFPARQLLINHAYTYPDSLYYPAFPIITSRGCPGNCTFCTAKSVHGKAFRCRSAENVLDEIEMLIRDYGAKEIHIWDDNFITNRKRVFAFRDGILRRNIKTHIAFPNGIRADCISNEILQALKDSGTFSIAIGVESGCQRILDSVQKGISLEQIEMAFIAAKKLKLETWGFFLLGLPGEDAETINQTIEFALKLDPCVAKFHILKPFPGSDVYNQLNERGLITDGCYDHYGLHTAPVHRLPTVTAEELLMWQKNAYRRYYLRPSKILREIMRLKTFHRCKHNVKSAVSLIKTMLR